MMLQCCCADPACAELGKRFPSRKQFQGTSSAANIRAVSVTSDQRKSMTVFGCASTVILVLAYVCCVTAQQQIEDASVQQVEATSSRSQNTVVGGMAVMFGRPDWGLGFGGRQATVSACTQQVQRIAERYGVQSTRASLKITPYFFYSWAMPADQQPGEDKYYRHIVTRWLVRDATYKQVEPTAQEISDYTEDFSKCIGAAITLGFKHVLVSPMIDPDYNQPECCPWRNAAEFDPTVILPGTTGNPSWSYRTLVLQPTLQAVKAALRASGESVSISWSLGAEQGRTFTVFASKWEQLAIEVKEALADVASRVWVGPNFDPLKLCGYYCDMYSSKTKVTEAQWEDFRSLLSTSTEVGVSSYPNVWDQYDPTRRALDVSQSARKLDEQLKEFAQTSVSDLKRGNTRIIYNELGFGGCKDWQCKLSDTPDIYELSSEAYNGAGSFESYDSPPTLLDPFRYMWTKSFRMEWYRQHLNFFRQKGSRATYVPHAAYIWSVGSWDVGAVYSPSSKGQDPEGVGCDPLNSYCDPDVLSMIKDFNQRSVVSSRPYFTLPGVKYHKRQGASMRSQVVPASAVALNVDLSKVPLWALPTLLARPRWG